MTARHALRVGAAAVTAVVLVVSAVYLLVYLYRWEWNRAVISGVFFLAAEVVVAAAVLSSRISSLERRLDDVADSTGGRGTAVEADVDVERESPFAWLDPASGRTGVFVPFLMGAGVILSAVAFVVERLSAAVASTAVAERPRARVGPPLPAGGLLAGAPPVPPAAVAAPTAGARRRSPVLALVATVVAAVVAFRLVDLIADATQARADPSPDVTTLEVDVRTRDGGSATAAEEAAALLVACQRRLDLGRAEVTDTAPGRARLSVTAVMGESARRKFVGCLEDATLEQVRAGVVSVSIDPADAPPAPPG